MKAEAVDERTGNWEVDFPAYRVYFFSADGEDEFVATLLAPLDRTEPVTLTGRRRARRRRLLVCAAVVVGILVCGVAVAGSLNPLIGIGAADRPKRASDTLDAGVQAQLRADSPPSGGVDQVGARLTDSARLVGTLPSGRKVYVVPSKKGRLCVVVAHSAESCGNSLTPAEPITFTAAWDRPGESAYAYGVALDGVRSVSFSYGGNRVTVPVEDNFFAYQTEPLDAPPGFGALIVTFDDGEKQAIR
jgi:hypothetical protein